MAEVESDCAGGCYGDRRRKKPALPFTWLVSTSLVLTVLIPLVTLLQLAEDRLVLVCSVKFVAAAGQEMTARLVFTSLMFKKTGGLVRAFILVIIRLKAVTP